MGFPYGWRAPIEARMITHNRINLLGVDKEPLAGASGSVILSEEGKYMGMVTKKLKKE